MCLVARSKPSWAASSSVVTWASGRCWSSLWAWCWLCLLASAWARRGHLCMSLVAVVTSSPTSSPSMGGTRLRRERCVSVVRCCRLEKLALCRVWKPVFDMYIWLIAVVTSSPTSSTSTDRMRPKRELMSLWCSWLTFLCLCREHHLLALTIIGECFYLL